VIANLWLLERELRKRLDFVPLGEAAPVPSPG
jgi:hypothetical protein